MLDGLQFKYVHFDSQKNTKKKESRACIVTAGMMLPQWLEALQPPNGPNQATELRNSRCLHMYIELNSNSRTSPA
jgi:hypothetical protein